MSIVLFTASDREDSTWRRWGASESENKTKHPILTHLPTPLPSNKELLHLTLPASNRGGKNSLSFSQQSSSSSFPGPLSLSSSGALGWTDGLRLFTAGSSRHKSRRPTTAPRHQHRRLCAVSSAASLLYTHPGWGKRHVAILFCYNFCFSLISILPLDLDFIF